MTYIVEHITDIVIGGVIIVSALLALANGLVRSVLSLAGWIGAAFATFWAFDLVSPHVRNLISEPTIANIVTGVAIFLVTLVFFSLIAAAAGNAMRRSSLSALDRTLGVVFGLARGAVLVSIGYLGLSAIVPTAEQPKWITQARALPLVQQSANWLKGFAPTQLQARLGGTVSDIERQAQQTRDAERAMRSAITPRTQANSPATPGETGYKTDDRRGLERLLQSNQPAPPPPPSQVAR